MNENWWPGWQEIVDGLRAAGLDAHLVANQPGWHHIEVVTESDVTIDIGTATAPELAVEAIAIPWDTPPEKHWVVIKARRTPDSAWFSEEVVTDGNTLPELIDAVRRAVSLPMREV